MKLGEEQNIENINFTLDKGLYFGLADDSEFKELGSKSEYENDILKNNENKKNGDQSNRDEEDDISLNTLI